MAFSLPQRKWATLSLNQVDQDEEDDEHDHDQDEEDDGDDDQHDDCDDNGHGDEHDHGHECYPLCHHFHHLQKRSGKGMTV